MVNVSFYRGDSEFIEDLPIKDGQLVYNTETGETFEDVGNQRIPTSDISLGLTGASVGQFITVASVDASGKPTGWKAETLINRAEVGA